MADEPHDGRSRRRTLWATLATVGAAGIAIASMATGAWSAEEAFFFLWLDVLVVAVFGMAGFVIATRAAAFSAYVFVGAFWAVMLWGFGAMLSDVVPTGWRSAPGAALVGIWPAAVAIAASHGVSLGATIARGVEPTSRGWMPMAMAPVVPLVPLIGGMAYAGMAPQAVQAPLTFLVILGLKGLIDLGAVRFELGRSPDDAVPPSDTQGPPPAA